MTDGVMLPPGEPRDRKHLVLDWRLNLNGVVTALALLVQIVALVVGGIWASARVDTKVDALVEQITGVKEEIKGIRADVAANATALRQEVRDSTSRLDRRIDALPRIAEPAQPYQPPPPPSYHPRKLDR